MGGIAGGAYTNSTAEFDNCVAKFCTISATSNYAGGNLWKNLYGLHWNI